VDDLGKATIVRKLGTEKFHSSGRSLGFDLESFWQWSNSDLLDNTARGILAEYLVARALGMGTADVRDAWNPCDIETSTGIRIQVKSAAYVQAWHQNKLSNIVFNVQSRRGWDSNTNVLSKTAQRHSDIYVFALLAHKTKSTIDPMNVDQWQFYVLPTEEINKRKRSQHSITLKSLEQLRSAIPYDSLKRVIEATGKEMLSNKRLESTSHRSAAQA
jgi:hypothetical protein